jgi:hypothetical protein
MKKYLLLLFCSLFAVVMAQAVSVDSYGTFDIYHYDAGEVQSGLTNVQAWSAAQLEDIHAAIDEWDRVILNAPARQIKLHVGWLAFDGDLLGVSASYTTNKNTQTLWTGSELAWREGDAAETDWDAYILLDVDAAGNQWNFGAGAPTASTYDFRSVITHEIGHSLGWITSYSSALDEFGQVSGGGLTAYDRFFGRRQWQ